MTGFAIGFLALAVASGAVKGGTATANVGGVLASAGNIVRWFVSPAVPCFPIGSFLALGGSGSSPSSGASNPDSDGGPIAGELTPAQAKGLGNPSLIPSDIGGLGGALSGLTPQGTVTTPSSGG